MKSTITLNESVRESLTQALLILMEKKEFEKITIQELTQLAGVCRSSFYRNFSSKEDILLTCVQDLYYDFFKKSSSEEFLYPRFAFIKNNRKLFTILYHHNLLDTVFRQMNSDLLQKIGGIPIQNNEYYASYVAGACTGVISQWIQNDFKESEEEMVAIFRNIATIHPSSI